MPITNQTLWDGHIKKNQDPYGEACVNVARRAMEILDETDGDFDCYKIIDQADDETKTGGITGFMSGAVAGMISGCHSRGEEFRRKWNNRIQVGNEGDAANEKGTILNPAVMKLDIDRR